MNENEKTQSDSTSSESDIMALLKKMQQQLAFLEKKIDTLVNNQSSERPSFKPRHFSKPPFRSFGNSSRHGHGKREHGQGQGPDAGGRGNFNRDRPFGDRPPREGDSGGNFAAGKKPFFRRRRDR